MGSVNVGGQALIEGIMIKSPDYVAVGVRKSDAGVKTKVEHFASLARKGTLLGLPFIRGIIILFEMLYIGMKQLIYSANEQEEDEEESLSPFHIVLTVLFSLGFALLLFKAIPLFITKMLSRAFEQNTITFNLIDGMIRILIFVLYIVVISFLKDVKTIFKYHGAEHMTIACYEHGKELTINNVRRYSTLHARCGTSFLVFTLLISILVFSIVPSNLPYFMLFLYRIPLIFPIAGISYEFLKLSDKFKGNWLLHQLVKPGLWFQKITTAIPTDQQIEVAIATLKALLKKQGV